MPAACRTDVLISTCGAPTPTIPRPAAQPETSSTWGATPCAPSKGDCNTWHLPHETAPLHVILPRTTPGEISSTYRVISAMLLYSSVCRSGCTGSTYWPMLPQARCDARSRFSNCLVYPARAFDI
jgi:hypothetical protein